MRLNQKKEFVFGIWLSATWVYNVIPCSKEDAFDPLSCTEAQYKTGCSNLQDEAKHSFHLTTAPQFSIRSVTKQV